MASQAPLSGRLGVLNREPNSTLLYEAFWHVHSGLVHGTDWIEDGGLKDFAPLCQIIKGCYSISHPLFCLELFWDRNFILHHVWVYEHLKSFEYILMNIQMNIPKSQIAPPEASYFGHAEVVQYLLQQNCDPDVQVTCRLACMACMAVGAERLRGGYMWVLYQTPKDRSCVQDPQFLSFF